MKILDSNMGFSSDNHFEQLNLSLDEKTQEKRIRQNQRRQRMDDPRDVPQILVDRVSVSQKETFEYQSNYFAEITSKASVKSIESGDVIEHGQQFAMEKLIGGIIDKDVAINSIQRREDIHFSNGENVESNVPDNVRDFVQTNAIEKWEMRLSQTDIHFQEENVQFASMGEVTTEDGRVINFSLDMSLDRTFLSRTEQETIVRKWQETVNLTDPLVISLDGKVPQLNDVTFEFDLDADGKMEKVSFVGPGSGFLAFDKNSDNVINNGSELFGPGTGNGFEELAAFDEDQNNWIDENDVVFSKLSVWTKSEKGEDMLISLKDAGIGAIALDYATTMFNMTKSDNTLKGRLKSTGMFLFENGNVGSIHQIDLASRAPDEIDEDTTTLPLDDTQVSPINGPRVLSSQMAINEPQLEDVSNPLQDLLDRIEKLKEEMGRLLKKMNPASNQNNFARSGQRHYLSLNTDSSTLLSGYKGPVRSRSRYL